MDQFATILVVDSDPGIRQVVEIALTESGYYPLLASNASAAIEIVRHREVDLVLLEWSLPDMDGTELCSLIKQNYNDTFIPVIMVTARAQNPDIVKGLDAGADDYLTKPFHLDEMLARVGSMLRIREQSFKQVWRLGGDSESIELRFNFPEAVSTPCKQYLLYFVDFLRNIGIEATADLREEAGQLLFAVTPKDKDEALDNIREALGVYLELPARQVVVPMASPETSIAVQQLGSQVLQFQSQIMLGNAIIQQKELALQQKDIIIQQQQSLIQQHMLTGEILVQSLKNEMEDDTEPVVGKLVRVKRWNPENIPLDVHLPEIIRYFKEKFSRKDLP